MTGVWTLLAIVVIGCLLAWLGVHLAPGPEFTPDEMERLRAQADGLRARNRGWVDADDNKFGPSRGLARPQHTSSAGRRPGIDLPDVDHPGWDALLADVTVDDDWTVSKDAMAVRFDREDAT